MSDLIDRQAAIDALIDALNGVGVLDAEDINTVFQMLPPSQLGTNLAEVGTDCISRQALLDKFEPWLKVKDYNDGELNMLKAVLYEIRFMRPAQPEPSQVAKDISRIVENEQDMRVIGQERIRGHWIIRETSSGDTEARCSHCGFTTLVDEPGNGLHMVSDLNFCPNCGADMREVTT